MKEPLFSPDFTIPETLKTKRFRLRPLTIHDVIKDYDAVMTSIEHIKGVFGPLLKWPSVNLTLEQDLIDLGWHQKEFQMGSSFAYAVVKLDESQCLGCVYIFPPTKKGFDVEVYIWVRKSSYNEGLDTILYKTVRRWLTTKWALKKVAYPGREIDWGTWNSMK